MHYLEENKELMLVVFMTEFLSRVSKPNPNMARYIIYLRNFSFDIFLFV